MPVDEDPPGVHVLGTGDLLDPSRSHDPRERRPRTKASRLMAPRPPRLPRCSELVDPLQLSPLRCPSG